MEKFKKYKRQYFMPPVESMEWTKKEYIDKAPIWCSVDLRDGNQALVEPMSLNEKLEFYQMLLEIGFKHIEVGFPAASDTEYRFLRTLIERNMIPEDVTVQVLTQARDHIIKRTFEAVDGAPNAVVHVYNSTSVAQREQVFRKSKEEIKEIAVNGAQMVYELAKNVKGNISFEYSPESFQGTEMDYALDVCNAVLEIWKPTKDRKSIINLPTTVENAIPHVFASQVEYISKNLKYRENVLLSLHPHNDRGSGICDAELGLLAGADRIEGTLFGNGERTGNVDIITLAMNLHSHGVENQLDFTNMKKIVKTYERLTGMQVSPRQPYAGDLVFTAFSGSHQDAIAKGMTFWEEGKRTVWDVPYLPIDPKDVGRTYDSDVIRINSQSGKGGVSYVLKRNYGLSIPYRMREELGYLVKDVSDKKDQELSAELIYEIFKKNYRDVEKKFDILECHFQQKDGIDAAVTIEQNGNKTEVFGHGNGRLDAVSNALKAHFKIEYELTDYEQHAVSRTTSSKAMSYVSIMVDGQIIWGAGLDEDIIKSSIYALMAAINRSGLL